jgi:hypothetical protein
MTGKKRDELESLITKYGGRCVDYGRKEGTSFDINNVREAITLFLDSLPVLEISDEEWTKRKAAKGAVVSFTIYSEYEEKLHAQDHPDWIIKYIPRPAPARLTDAEIEKKARILADELNYELTQTGSRQGAFLKALDAYFAEKARLDAERSS